MDQPDSSQAQHGDGHRDQPDGSQAQHGDGHQEQPDGSQAQHREERSAHPGPDAQCGPVHEVPECHGTPAHHAVPPAWRRRTEGEHRWPAATAVLVTMALQVLTPVTLAPRPRWLPIVVELALFAAVVGMNPARINRESALLRRLGVTLTTVLSVVTAWSVALLVYRLVAVHTPLHAPDLLRSGVVVWLTNVIVFALWYWEGDLGGPAARAAARDHHPDFLFPQMASPDVAEHNWEPTFVDYLYLSFTNATAFSPTDTMPLARWAKLAMMLQATVSLITVGLVVARAVNILG